jgi:hypothetical protein
VKPGTSAYVWCNIANQSRKSSVATPSGDGAVHWQQSLSITAPSLEAIYNDKLQVSATPIRGQYIDILENLPSGLINVQLYFPNLTFAMRLIAIILAPARCASC